MDNGGGFNVLLLSMCFMSFCVDSAFVAMFEYSYKRKKKLIVTVPDPLISVTLLNCEKCFSKFGFDDHFCSC